jgi:diguanylate cyclase (GGDEF)-like protein
MQQEKNESSPLHIKNPELFRQSYTIKALSVLAIVFTLPLWIMHYSQGDYALAAFLLAISFLSAINFYLFYKNKIKYTLSSDLLLYPLLALMLYLVATGGVDNTGALWIYAIPVISLFLYGLRKGLVVLLFFSAIVVLILFLPADILDFSVQYSFDFKIRLILVFLLVVALTLAYAYSTQKLFSQMHLMNERLTMMAEEDQLTRLQNRRGIQYQLKRLYEDAQRTGKNFSIILCDIDFFKDINDRYGHQIGDQVLIEIAQIIKETIRKSDMAARWGGEEFLIVLPGARQREAYQVAEKIRQNVLKFPFYYQGQELRISLSSGVSQMKDAASIDDLIRQADDYMYQAKSKGRNLTMPFFLGEF